MISPLLSKLKITSDSSPPKKVLKAAPHEMHGHQGDPQWKPPIMVTENDSEARPGYQTKKAHEYDEDPETLGFKIKLLAQMIKKSKNCLVYSGAGLSTSSGINDYASRENSQTLNGRPKLRSPLDALPTPAHHVLVAMYKSGYIKHWVQQNHDGLPQKAGLPQADKNGLILNEIHGAWYDVSNPVVPMDGILRGDLFELLEYWEKKSDLTLALGSSLCGMNADRVVETPGKKYLKGIGLGSVIVSIQQTQYDHICSLRIFSKLDHVFELLAKELNLKVEKYTPKKSNSNHKYTIPYKNAHPCPGEKMVLDLSLGQKVKILFGNYAGDIGEVVGMKQGHYQIRFEHYLKRKGRKQPFLRLFGWWMLESLSSGFLPYLPIENVQSDENP